MPLGFAAVVAAVALPLGPAAAVILPVAFLGATLWSFVLDVAIREVHRLSTGRAVGAVVLPIAVGFGLLVLLFGALLAALFAAG